MSMEGFPMRLHLRAGKSWWLGFGILGGCHPASIRISPEPRKGLSREERRKAGAHDLTIMLNQNLHLLHFSPCSALWGGKKKKEKEKGISLLPLTWEP